MDPNGLQNSPPILGKFPTNRREVCERIAMKFGQTDPIPRPTVDGSFEIRQTHQLRVGK